MRWTTVRVQNAASIEFSGEKSRCGEQGSIAIEVLGGNATELSHHCLEATVEAVHRIQVVDLVVGFMSNQRNLFAVLLLRQIIVARDPVKEENGLFRNMIAQRVHNVLGTRLGTIDAAGNPMMIAVGRHTNAQLVV